MLLRYSCLRLNCIWVLTWKGLLVYVRCEVKKRFLIWSSCLVVNCQQKYQVVITWVVHLLDTSLIYFWASFLASFLGLHFWFKSGRRPRTCPGLVMFDLSCLFDRKCFSVNGIWTRNGSDVNIPWRKSFDHSAVQPDHQDKSWIIDVREILRVYSGLRQVKIGTRRWKILRPIKQSSFFIQA